MSEGIHGTLTGRVKSTFTYAHGIALVVEVLREGRKFADNVVVWGVPDSFTAGDRVKIEGDVWAVLKEKNGRNFVDVTVNNPVVLEVNQRAPMDPAEPYQPDVSWPAPADNEWPTEERIY